jgi:acyl-CoA thioester hydrolase
VPHTYQCPMRWADMDLLGHVNNVTYLDYVAEAREDLFPGSPTGLAPVVRQQVEFLSPLVFHRSPVLVDSWVTGVSEETLALAHEIYDPATSDGHRTVHARISSLVAATPSPDERGAVEALRAPDHTWRQIAGETRPGGSVYPLTVRRADVDAHGVARDVAFFEYFQEARIQFLMSLHTRGEHWSHHVVARTDIDFVAPVVRRSEPYAVRSWVGHVGTRSFTIQAEVLDGERVLARAAVVMVTFDRDTQRPTDMSSAQRARLLAELG